MPTAIMGIAYVSESQASKATTVNDALDKIDLRCYPRRGLASARPAAASALEGLVYYSSDSGAQAIERCNGASWDNVAPAWKSLPARPPVIVQLPLAPQT